MDTQGKLGTKGKNKRHRKKQPNTKAAYQDVETSSVYTDTTSVDYQTSNIRYTPLSYLDSEPPPSTIECIRRLRDQLKQLEQDLIAQIEQPRRLRKEELSVKFKTEGRTKSADNLDGYEANYSTLGSMKSQDQFGRLENTYDSLEERSRKSHEELERLEDTYATLEAGNNFYPDQKGADTLSREDVKAQREAKKREKQATKVKNKGENYIRSLENNVPDSVFTSTDRDVTTPSSDGRSKAEIRAERRNKQEAQRSAKQQQKGQAELPTPVPTPVTPTADKPKDIPPVKPAPRKVKAVSMEMQKKAGLFAHLERPEKVGLNAIHYYGSSPLHPAVVQIGLQMREGNIRGSNARGYAIITALKQVILDYITPPQCDLSRDLEWQLSSQWRFLSFCRQPSVSMTAVLKFIKGRVRQVSPAMLECDAKLMLTDALDDFGRENIDLAGEAIAMTAAQKIQNGDTILTYGCSSLVARVLREAGNKCRTFRVLVLDAPPLWEGKEMLRRLVKSKIPCSYALITAASALMPRVTKVFLGAHSLLANGWVMGRAGCGQVALLAKTYNVPVLVCCETYKFCERVQTDAFVFNELGDPVAMMEPALLQAQRCLSLLWLLYDVTPPDLVSAVLTELAALPCTSVPAVLRLKHS